MDTKEINLDGSAEALYAQFGGVEERKLKKLDFSGSDRLFSMIFGLTATA